MNLRGQKRLAADILKCGVSRVRITESKDVGEALTRNDIRELIGKGLITKVQKKGQHSGSSKKTLSQKKKGRRSGQGSRKGSSGARNPSKRAWIKSVRAQRKLLTELKDKGQVQGKDYRSLYRKIKGGMFRSKSHMMLYITDHEMLKPYSKSRDTRPEKAQPQKPQFEGSQPQKESAKQAKEKKGK